MAYVDPETVVAPKSRIREISVIYNAGRGEWSAALVEWDGKEVLALRWNGSDEQNGIGNPQSRGKPTWFIVPDQLRENIEETIEQLPESQEGGLLAGYRAMAEDREREKEAQEWSEALIGDGAGQER